MGIYLLHPLFINALEMLGLNMSLERPVLSVLGFTALLALISALAALAGKKLPLVRKLL